MKYITILFVLTLAACSSKYHSEKWIATQDMPAFAKPNDDINHPIFTIKKGDICTPLEDMELQKIYAYTKVKCTSGTGWVVDDYFRKPPKVAQ
jgi:hypothetical protein